MRFTGCLYPNPMCGISPRHTHRVAPPPPLMTLIIPPERLLLIVIVIIILRLLLLLRSNSNPLNDAAHLAPVARTASGVRGCARPAPGSEPLKRLQLRSNRSQERLRDLLRNREGLDKRSASGTTTAERLKLPIRGRIAISGHRDE